GPLALTRPRRRRRSSASAEEDRLHSQTATLPWSAPVRRTAMTTLQLNLGRYCNIVCTAGAGSSCTGALVAPAPDAT
ncbi:MAG TPA: hypothetical protein VFT55_03255, partial [Planctomycetota bacterium]|nr:hypothetical protein [Planctomycetota bacterium]